MTAVAAVLLAVTAGCSSGGGAPPVTYGGKPVKNLATVAPAADAAFQRAATAAHATDVSASGCYLTESGSVVTGGWCGPVAYPGDPLGDDWQLLNLKAEVVSGGVSLVSSVGAHGQPAPVAVRLIRPGQPAMEVPSSAVPSDAQLLPPGQLAVLDGAGVPLTPPADGRLRGLDTTAVVTGVARAAAAGQANGGVSIGPQVVEAGPGQVLAVASFTITDGQSPPGVNGTPETAFSVIADGTAVPVPASATQGGPVTVAVSVAQAGGTALLQMTEGPLTESFDLLAGKRVEPYPAVLYHDATNAFVNLAVGQAQTATVVDGSESATFSVSLTSASLQDVAPDGSVPADSAHEWLVAQFNGPDVATPADGPGIGLYEPNTPFVTAVLPDGTKVAGLETPPTVSSDGFLPQYVWFPIPSDTSDVKLVMDGPSVDGLGNATTISGATFDVPIPAAAAVTPAAGAPSLVSVLEGQVPEPAPAATGGTSGSGGGQFPAWIVAVGLLALIMVVVLVVRNRGRRPVAPAPAGPHPGWGGLVGTPPPPEETPVSTNGTTAPAPPVDATVVSGNGLGRDGHFPLLSEPEPIDEPDGTGRPRLTLFGRVGLTGCPGRAEGREAKITELLACIAAHDDGVTADELLAMVWRAGAEDSKEISKYGVQQAVSRARALIGAHRLPKVTGSRPYTLVDFEVDWWEFRELAAEADRLLAADRPAVAAERWTRALALVIGQPFQGVSANGPFGWVPEKGIDGKMTGAVLDAAHRLAKLSFDLDDPSQAKSAAEKARMIEPRDEQSYQDRLLAAFQLNDRAEFERVWDDAKANLDDIGPGGPVGDTYRQLKVAWAQRTTDRPSGPAHGTGRLPS